MPGIFSSIKTRVSNTVNLIFFPGEKTRFERNVRRLRDLVILLLLSVLLWFITVRTRLDTSVRAPLLVLRPFWLVFLLWSGVLTYHSFRRMTYLLRLEPSFSLYPEIEENWNYIKQKMAELSVSPNDLPIVLVLGHRPIDGVHFFDHLQLRLRNVTLRNESESNFQVDLTESAIIITCQNASALGAYTRRVELARAPFVQSVFNDSKQENTDRTPSQLIGLSGDSRRVQETENLEQERSKSFKPKTDLEDVDRSLVTQDEMKHLSAKLKYLCELIAADRYPYCPVNGVVLVVSKEVMESEQFMANAIEMSRIDMDSIRLASGLDFPYAVLASNMHRLQGFENLVSRLDTNSKMRYLGIALHTRIDLAPELWSKQIRKGLRWFRQRALPAMVAKELLKVPPSALGQQTSQRGSVIQSNHKAYIFLQEAGKQWKRLEYFCTRIGQIQMQKSAGNPRFAGLFMTGLENTEVGPWVFIHEFVKHILTQQDSISWTPETLSENRKWSRLARVIIVLVLIMIAMVVAGLIWIYMG